MKFSVLESLRSIIRPIHAVVNDVASLEHAIYQSEKNNPYWLNKNSIKQSSVAKIHELNSLGKNSYHTNIWKYGNSASYVNELKELLTDMFKVKKISKITINISDVAGLSASKAPLEDYCTMQQFVEKDCRIFFELTEDSLNRNLAHQEIRILHREKPSDHFKMYGWSDKLFLSNSGGSHHFASAQYIAKHLSINIPIAGEMILHHLHEEELLKFLKTFSSVLIPFSDFCYLNQKFEHSGLDLLFFQSSSLPAETVILFYKHVDMPCSIDSLLKDRFTDFNKELIKFYNLQKTNAQFQRYMAE